MEVKEKKGKTNSKFSKPKPTKIITSESQSDEVPRRSKHITQINKEKRFSDVKNIKDTSKEQISFNSKPYKGYSSNSSSESSNIHKSSYISSNVQNRKLRNINPIQSYTSEPEEVAENTKHEISITNPPNKRSKPEGSKEEQPRKIPKYPSNNEDSCEDTLRRRPTSKIISREHIEEESMRPACSKSGSTIQKSFSVIVFNPARRDNISKDSISHNHDFFTDELLPKGIIKNSVKRKHESNENFDDEKIRAIDNKSSDCKTISLRKSSQGLSVNKEAKINLSHRIKTSDANVKSVHSVTIPGSPKTYRDMILESSHFVDKSLFIKEIIESSSSSIIITRPRRWGKSLNLDMLKIFLQPQLNENGCQEFMDNIDNALLFKGGEVTYEGETKILKKLEIANHTAFKFQGEYPVLFLKFYSIGDYQGEDPISHIKSIIRTSFSEAYKNHPYIYKKLLVEEIRKYSNTNSTYDDEHIETLRDKIQVRGRYISKELQVFQGYWLEDVNFDICRSLRILIEYIFEYFNERVYVLIDEYDALMNSAIEKPYYDYVKSTMSEIYSLALKNNKKIKKTVMVGILPFSARNLSAGTNNFTIYTINHNYFSSSFGFNQDEVTYLMDAVFKHNKEAIISERNKIKKLYKGYNIENQSIYNPWFICQYLSAYLKNEHKPLQLYWADPGDPRFIRDWFDKLPKAKSLDKLICRGNLKYAIDNSFRLGDGITESIFFSLLVHTGYLTRTEDRNEVKSEGSNLYTIPNEVKHSFFEALSAAWIKNRFGLNPDIALPYTTKLAKCLPDSRKYIEKLVAYINKFKGLIQREADIRVFVVGSTMIACLDEISLYRAYPEYLTTTGNRIDHIFIPIDQRSEKVIIHEYKRIIEKDIREGTVREFLENACWQIYAQDYLSAACNLYLQYEDSAHWKFISTRSILFYKSTDTDEWNLRCVWFDHRIDQVRRLTDIFKSTKKKIKNPLLLTEQGVTSKYERRFFLQSIQGSKYDSIFDLLSDFSVRRFLIEPLEHTNIVI